MLWLRRAWVFEERYRHRYENKIAGMRGENPERAGSSGNNAVCLQWRRHTEKRELARTWAWDQDAEGSQDQSEVFGHEVHRKLEVICMFSAGKWCDHSFPLAGSCVLDRQKGRETGGRETNQEAMSRTQPSRNDYLMTYSCVSLFQRWLHTFLISLFDFFFFCPPDSNFQLQNKERVTLNL